MTLPLSLPGVIAGTLLTFIPAAGDFINAQLLGTPRQYMIGNVIQSRFLEITDYPTAAALSFVLMALILVAIFIYARDRNGEADGMSIAAERLPVRPGPGALTRVLAVARRQVLTAYSCSRSYLLLPIGIVVLFSFNHPAGRFNYTWQGFTLDNWKNWDGVPGMRSAIELSLEIAALASLLATALGTLIALALVRYRFRGARRTNLLIFLPMSSPEIVLGASLLTLFLSTSQSSTRFWTILIAHVMFCISYVVVTVKARLIGFDRHLEEAAMDLGANELRRSGK